MFRARTFLLLFAVALLVAGCSGDEEPDREPSAGAKAPAGETDRARPTPKEADEARREAAERKLEEQERKDLEDDREFDSSFKETSFERLVDRLPIRRPPLYVQRYITGDGHRLYASVNVKRFCRASAGGRERAVAAFFRTADRTFRRGDVEDLEVVVTPISETIDELPALATARGGEVELSGRGRGC